ncbi:MAG: DUF167 domain-containing protein [Chloroflexi bacterium]|nr:DUF167 domain-containing protein [Chloroflexota bacterium]
MPTTRLKVRAQPNARVSEILGATDGVLRVRVAAAPVEGKANKALVELLANALGVPKSFVRVTRGAASRDKLVEVEGLSLEEAMRRLARG